ncbi:Cd(II)/Pb(II)-sensing metalloregulatory transcriptional regulator CmtR [Nocardiopsis chromatogenes]|uniref:Cd(II)/Pb(II)-sensing metalloregulatory transcriptional regulator CmtR n=1 Tax=Nocardiopsis chromatogenes TaxID=280239 RepID=UPI000476E654|nr:metalloregulator ArsR/SmtB family transcription factor [Nocardiopsis chromatogenes]
MVFMLTSEQRLSAIHRLGRALADPTRCRLLLALLEGPRHPAGLADTLGLTRQNVSNHLACLRECGLVQGRQRGRQVTYELVDASLAHALEDLLGVVWGVAEEHTPPGETTPVPAG